jgi:hypothetical protein
VFGNVATPNNGVKVMVVAVVYGQVSPGRFDNAPPENVSVIVPAHDVSVVGANTVSTFTTGAGEKAEPDCPPPGWVVKTSW